MRLGVYVVVSSLLFSASCVERRVAAMPMTQPGDENLGCTELREQYAGNVKQALVFAGQDETARSINQAVAIASLITVVPQIVAADPSMADQVQFKAIVDRNTQLARLARAKGCPIE